MPPRWTPASASARCAPATSVLSTSPNAAGPSRCPEDRGSGCAAESRPPSPACARSVRAGGGPPPARTDRAHAGDGGRDSAAQPDPRSSGHRLGPAAFGEVDKTEVAGAQRADALAGVQRGGILVGKLYAEQAGLAVGDRVALR